MVIYGPENIIDLIGARNGYITAIVIALLGGLSLFTSAFFYLTIITLVIGGLDPYVLSVICGSALFIGDSFVFYIGYSGKQAFSDKMPRIIIKLSEWLSRQKDSTVQAAVLILGITPFPHDIIMLILSVIGYKYKKIWLVILLADFLVVMITGVLAQYLPEIATMLVNLRS